MKTFNVIIAIALVVALDSCRVRNGKSDAYGNFEAVEVTVSSEIPGKLLRLSVEEGMVLKAGEEAGLVDTVDVSLRKQVLEAQYRAVSARLTGVNAQVGVQSEQLKNLLTEKARLEKLYRDKAATGKQLDDMDGSIRVLEKQIHATQVQRVGIEEELGALERQTAQASETLLKCHIVNPAGGTVLAKYAEAGEVTGAGRPLYKIADLDQMILKVYVSGAQLPEIRIGQKVRVWVDKDEVSNRSMEGTVSWISSSAEFSPKIIQTKDERVNLVYAVKVRVKNDGSLKIAMPGEVDFN